MNEGLTEADFEENIVASLVAAGYRRAGGESPYDAEDALFPKDLTAFVEETQPTEWAKLARLHDGRPGGAVVAALVNEIEARGCLDVLRHGFKCSGTRLRAASFRPASGMNPRSAQRYAANRLVVANQLYYGTGHRKSLDVALAVNGVPVVTMELKNHFTNQRVADGQKQYRTTRDPREPLLRFNRRALVHFVVDPDSVKMTTRLAGADTYFLPFDRGHDDGAGNPPNPAGVRTAYLWEEVLTPDSLLDLIQRFLHLKCDRRREGGKTVTKETLIFPRYHQLDAVRRLERQAAEHGSGGHYLIQHSAGSGKSNSIAWLAHRLANLHAGDERVFDSVIVITDRVILDSQLQDTVYQFDHKRGVVVKIDRDTKQLTAALAGGTDVIITTLQKFPYVNRQLTEQDATLAGRRFAVIVDEAHSSQSGEMAAELKKVLAAAGIRDEAARQAADEGLELYRQQILCEMLARGRQANIGYFAFTATPKPKTLEVFGARDESGRPAAFHRYSMRQAIEEGFILDVLAHYVSYKTYFRLVRTGENVADKQVEKGKARKALARFMSLHPTNISQKVEVIVEHFRRHTRHKIGGKAKAMVVTDSRLAAVRYHQALTGYVERYGYDDVHPLVAFSGTVEDPEAEGVHHTEGSLNDGIAGGQIPEQFDTDGYNVLIAADKFQTGFDQPLLHTMYVDKRLAGIQAVQTLSRLNRVHPGKEDTFVLDLRDQQDEVLAAFNDYYTTTTVQEDPDPQQLETLRSQIMAAGVIHPHELEEFARLFFTGDRRRDATRHPRINALLDPAVCRFNALATADGDDAENDALREQLRGRLTAFRGLYSFLSQVLPYTDEEQETLYAYARLLLRKLPRAGTGTAYDFGGDVALQYYRLQCLERRRLELTAEAGGELKGPTAVGSGRPKDETVELSTLIATLNDRLGTEFTDADQCFFDSVARDALRDEELRRTATANSLENFGFKFDRAVEDLIYDRRDQNDRIVDRFLDGGEFARIVKEKLREQVYQQANAASV